MGAKNGKRVAINLVKQTVNLYVHFIVITQQWENESDLIEKKETSRWNSGWNDAFLMFKFKVSSSTYEDFQTKTFVARIILESIAVQVSQQKFEGTEFWVL